MTRKEATRAAHARGWATIDATETVWMAQSPSGCYIATFSEGTRWLEITQVDSGRRMERTANAEIAARLLESYARKPKLWWCASLGGYVTIPED